jgi:hypothetical protein
MPDLTAQEYRARALALLTPPQPHLIPADRAVTEAGVWADLAISAAISETSRTPAAQNGSAQ